MAGAQAFSSHLRPLKPKRRSPPLEECLSRVRVTSSAPKSRRRNHKSGCFVPICRITHCKLDSHHHYGRQESSTKRSAIPFEPMITAALSLVSVLGHGSDGLPSLPTVGLDLDEGHLRRLFHLYFTRDFPRSHSLVAPPALSKTEKSKATVIRQVAVEQALSDPLNCLTVLAAAELQNVFMHQTGTCLHLQIYSEIVGLLRTKLDDADPEMVKTVIQVMFVMIQFDLLFNNINMLDAHRQALEHLVTGVGGIYGHNVNQSLHALVYIDRITAVCVEKEPLFAPQADRSLFIATTLPEIYGRHLHEELHGIDPDIVEYCQDVNVAIELLEKEKWAYDLGDTIPDGLNSSNIYYFYFLKDTVANSFAHMQARDYSVKPKSLAVLLAANIVQYITLQDHYIAPYAILLANRLQTTLRSCNIYEEWTGKLDILRWMICVLLCLPRKWNGRTWALNLYLATMNRTHSKEKWPQDWRVIESSNVCGFVWSSSRMMAKFKTLLDEVNMMKQLSVASVCKL